MAVHEYKWLSMGINGLRLYMNIHGIHKHA